MQNDRRQSTKSCRKCGRLSDSDLRRNYCPVTARVICASGIADSCKFYVPKKDEDRCSSKE